MRIGILGGAFDPIHNGHLALAHAAVEKLKLDRVLFISAGISPMGKNVKAQTPAELRYQMVQAAISGISHFQISDVEIRRKGVSYSVDTLRELRAQFPAPHELFWLVGADWAGSLSQWKDIDTIFKLCQMVVASRPGFPVNSALPKQVISMEFEPLDLSSSQIRTWVSAGKNIESSVPSKVLELIKKEKLYQT